MFCHELIVLEDATPIVGVTERTLQLPPDRMDILKDLYQQTSGVRLHSFGLQISVFPLRSKAGASLASLSPVHVLDDLTVSPILSVKR